MWRALLCSFALSILTMMAVAVPSRSRLNTGGIAISFSTTVGPPEEVFKRACRKAAALVVDDADD